MQPRKSKRSKTCNMGTSPPFIKFYLTFIHIKKVKINIPKIMDEMVILSFYTVSSFFIILEIIEI